ncbi:hypothetical protein AB4Y32_39730 [Paraburkholderia phymatum]|uniref:Uncharacterized protein n=1 Tax=Paraburkholderia phymatum TaxID=148447 RepID=A0ACC6UEC8_9BURK
MLEADDSMCKVTLLKREPKDFNYKELQQKSERQAQARRQGEHEAMPATANCRSEIG